MKRQGLLVYQPSHGLGMELYLVHVAARLAVLLNRVLVLPRIPVLETIDYQGGIDQYFEIPAALDWISTSEFIRRTGGRIDHLFQVLPVWRADFMDARNRQLHPVWVDTLENCRYFDRLGFSVRSTSQLRPDAPFAEDEARDAFSSSAHVVAISYVNELLEGDTDSTFHDPDDDFAGRSFTPPAPQASLRRMVRERLGREPDAAAHIRTQIFPISHELNRTSVPSIDAYWSAIPEHAELVYIATDDDDAFGVARAAVRGAVRLTGPNAVASAVIDMTACVIARLFVGTRASTFSQYVGHARALAGKSRSLTVLL